jgi:hypothetical protein
MSFQMGFCSISIERIEEAKQQWKDLTFRMIEGKQGLFRCRKQRRKAKQISMGKFIGISDRKTLNELLSKLQSNILPLWGTLTPIGLIEHLITTMEYTNGKKITVCNLTPEQIEIRKQAVIYSDAELPRGIKTPLSKEDPAVTMFETLPEAIAALNKELDAFEKYFETIGAVSVHPGFGELNYNEWVIFHGKHFTHHLNQFGLLA